MRSFKQTIIVSLGILLFISACKRRQTSWDVNVAVPLFSTSLSLNDVNKGFLNTNATDSSYNLVYDNLIYSARLTNVRTPDTTINTSFTLKRLKLSDRSIVQNITLGQINPLFKLLDGQTSMVPAQDQSNLNPVDIDASAFFETATLDSGFLDISLKNDLPVKVVLILFEITNASDGSVVASDSFKDIPKGATSTKTINLAGKTVNKSLKGTIKRLITEGSSGPVLIEANKGVELTLSVRRLRPNNAIAAFPNQTVIDQDQGLVLDMGGPQIKYFKVKSGKLHITLESTIRENMTMEFKLPGATKNGLPIERTIHLPGAPATGSVKEEETIDMAEYLIDFRGKNPDVDDTVNTFHQILRVTLDSSGRKVQVTLRDSIRIYYRMESLEPEYAIGYMGNSVNQAGPDWASFELFKGMDGDITLQNFTASVLMRNYVGAEGRIKINKLEGENIFSGKKVLLNATPLASPIGIVAPAFTRDAFTEKTVVLNTGNSNVKQFMELLPQKVNYDLTVETNPNGNTSNYHDFIFDNSRVDIFLRLETPATFAIGGLNLRDTQPINTASIKRIDRIKSAKLYLDIENDFPFDVDFEVSFLGESFNYLGTADFDGSNTVKAAIVDASGVMKSPVKSRLVISLPKDKVFMLTQGRHVVIKAKVKGAGGKQKIYNTYKIKASANGQFEYETNF